MIVHPNSVFPFEGGESPGLAHLQNYIWNKNLVKSYKQTRNCLIGSENTTKFSAWLDGISFQLLNYIQLHVSIRLSNGSLSPRKIFFELKRYENERGIPDVGYWIIFELLWHDFFQIYWYEI